MLSVPLSRSTHRNASMSLDSRENPPSFRRNVTMESISHPSYPFSTTAIPSTSQALMHISEKPNSARSIFQMSPLLRWSGGASSDVCRISPSTISSMSGVLVECEFVVPPVYAITYSALLHWPARESKDNVYIVCIQLQ